MICPTYALCAAQARVDISTLFQNPKPKMLSGVDLTYHLLILYQALDYLGPHFPVVYSLPPP